MRGHISWVVLAGAFAASGACGGDGGSSATDAGPDAVRADGALGCAPPVGAGTEHQGVIAADEVWTAADSPHVVLAPVTVDDATLTIEPCAVVRLRGGHGIHVTGTDGVSAGALVARGPVTFERDVVGEPWGTIGVDSAGMLDLEDVTLTGGGDHATAQSNGGTIVATGEGGNTGLTRNVRVLRVTIEGSAGFGINLQTRAAFTEDSDGLVIRGAGALPSGTNVDTSVPVYVDAPALASIPPGTYTGNARDGIDVGGAGSLLEDVTFRARGVPYRLLTGLSMGPVRSAADGGLLTLTIEAGVELRFPNGAPGNSWTLRLGVSNGALPENLWPVRLIAAGTAEAPIVLTSDAETPAAGDWSGIEWAAGPAAGNVMSHVRVEYAGGDSGTQGFGCGPSDNDAALLFTNWRPGDAFITDSTFVDSAAGGIVCGWSSDEAGPDFLESNTFTRIGNGCEVARWADGAGTCPSAPPICL